MRPPTRKSATPICEPSSAPSKLKAIRRKSAGVLLCRYSAACGRTNQPDIFIENTRLVFRLWRRPGFEPRFEFVVRNFEFDLPIFDIEQNRISFLHGGDRSS